MKLYIKQKVFALRDSFQIYNEYKEPQFTVKGKYVSVGKKLTLFDRNDQEVLKINQKIFTFLPKFFLIRNGETVATVRKKFTFFRDRYVVPELGWTVQGSFTDHKYEITDENGNVIASVSKKWIAWGDTYEFDFDTTRANADLALGVVLVVDACIELKGGTRGVSIIRSGND